MTTSPDEPRHEAVSSAAPLRLTHTEMALAQDNGHATPLSRVFTWMMRYRGSWWIDYEHGWLRVTDHDTTAELDDVAARLAIADTTTGHNAAQEKEK